MSYTNSKSIKRFSFGISRNDTSHAAGANTVTITTAPADDYYSTSMVGLTMTVKEARALQSFLNNEMPVVDTDVSV